MPQVTKPKVFEVLSDNQSFATRMIETLNYHAHINADKIIKAGKHEIPMRAILLPAQRSDEFVVNIIFEPNEGDWLSKILCEKTLISFLSGLFGAAISVLVFLIISQQV